MSPMIANSPADAHASPPTTPERQLLCAVLAQAVKDLRSPDPYVSASARRFWLSEHQDLAWLCEQLGLDMAQVRAQIRRRYPEVWAPRQLELQLKEAS